ncbi:hypothetical protein [Fimbriimonas ginsengisoli]|uniref:Uncharacterized protein n=1 Tax=Fimbriimonas ginsengisoli Gsoil 348 TaxID=661478 RepID=A0A068NXH2_FIMGI|nr:hypothetical protein [Fimbriimonas ginsengisoli]AIE87465.1 hypothetical protein OP10G_4097 [Fimbriimonas ginsengisoli Gsoil 348]
MVLFKYVSDWGDSLVIEDDDRCGYAYLLVDGKFVSDVWLYNAIPPPERPEWELENARNLLPFANSVGFVRGEIFEPLTSSSEIFVSWGELGDKLEAAIHLRGKYHALLREGEKPGYCRLAAKDGPLAKTLLPPWDADDHHHYRDQVQ